MIETNPAPLAGRHLREVLDDHGVYLIDLEAPVRAWLDTALQEIRAYLMLPVDVRTLWRQDFPDGSARVQLLTAWPLPGQDVKHVMLLAGTYDPVGPVSLGGATESPAARRRYQVLMPRVEQLHCANGEAMRRRVVTLSAAGALL